MFEIHESRIENLYFLELTIANEMHTILHLYGNFYSFLTIRKFDIFPDVILSKMRLRKFNNCYKKKNSQMLQFFTGNLNFRMFLEYLISQVRSLVAKYKLFRLELLFSERGEHRIA